MLDKRRRKRKKSARSARTAGYAAGLLGVACLTWALAGLAEQWPGAEAGPVAQSPPESFYPLEVGRYWVYTYQKPGEEHKVLVERRIESRATQADRELFFLNDGSLLYHQAGKVFELGHEGSLNVVPLDGPDLEQPFVYRSQGLHIEKRIGAIDTVVVVNGRRFEDCVEVITAFRPVEGSRDSTFSYASYYARGIGLIGRATPDAAGAGGLSVVLEDYGTRSL